MIDRGEELGFLDIESEEAAPLLDPLPEDERFKTWQLVRPDGSLVCRGQGVVWALGCLSATRPLGAVLGRPRLVGILDRLDAVVSRNRKRLGRFVPDGPAPSRFP